MPLLGDAQAFSSQATAYLLAAFPFSIAAWLIAAVVLPQKVNCLSRKL